MRADPRKELRRFLAEDVGCGDITSALLPNKTITARIVSREPAILAGITHVRWIFELGRCRAKILRSDGQRIKKNHTILSVTGTARGVLSCERTALNLLSRMSGIATQTDELARIVRKSSRRCRVYATRKTAPGLRYFDKEAVEIGGGMRHRMSLDESILIKDNHLAVGSLESMLAAAKRRRKKAQVEVETKADAIRAVRLGADAIMLDNFTPHRAAGTITELEGLGLRRRIKIEASGGIKKTNIAKFAQAGVDMISVGSITNSVHAIDFALEV